MRVEHPLPIRPTRRAVPSFWIDPTDAALPQLDRARQGNARSPCPEDAAKSRVPVEENARLRELLAQLSDIIRRSVVRPG